MYHSKRDVSVLGADTILEAFNAFNRCNRCLRINKMIRFKLKDAKDKAREDMANIRDYGHPSYSHFNSVLSVCKRYQLCYTIAPDPINLLSGKSAYRVEDLTLVHFPEGVDPETDEGSQMGDVVASVDYGICHTKADVWAFISEFYKNYE